jgi:hypothetical protein
VVLTDDEIDCPWSPGDVEANIRSDIQALKASPHMRKDIPIIGYVLDISTAQLREVKYVLPPSSISPYVHAWVPKSDISAVLAVYANPL